MVERLSRDERILRKARKVFAGRYPERVIRELSYDGRRVSVQWTDVYTRLAGTSLVDPVTFEVTG